MSSHDPDTEMTVDGVVPIRGSSEDPVVDENTVTPVLPELLVLLGLATGGSVIGHRTSGFYQLIVNVVGLLVPTSSKSGLDQQTWPGPDSS